MPTVKSKQTTEKLSHLNNLIEKLNAFSADNYWDLGKFLVEKFIPAALKEGIFGDVALKTIASAPGFKFPYSMLKQCQQFYTYYPDVEKRLLPEIFYFDLATKVDDSTKRREYEKMAIDRKWTISDLRKKIHDDELARRMDEKTKYGFDLKEKNFWSFEAADPRFGKPNYKGRIPGQVITNLLFYYTNQGAYIVDPFAGSGTLGDIIDTVQIFQDRKYKLYDIEPSDNRIVRNNILQTGIPEQTASVDYVFLDPPSEFFPQTSDSAFTASAAKADTMLKLKGVVRESARILKKGGRVTIIIEPTIVGLELIDFPGEVASLMKEFDLKQIGKVYMPRRSDSSKASRFGGEKSLISEIREILTFEKI
ncbi:MAG: DNA methyltransferase [Bacteroidota bacterium]|nr:DNA methyltransferase [Bacteroidota bacterium]